MAKNCDENIGSWLYLVKAAASYQKLFITGCPKSGTTWLQWSLNGHPQIVANGEGRVAWRLLPYLHHAVALFNQDHRAHVGCTLAEISDGELALVMRAMTDHVFMRYLNASGKPPGVVRVLADKTPQHVTCIETLRTIYPTCRFINIVRDPRDAATSALFHLARGDKRTKEQYVHAFITESWRLHVEAAVKAAKELGPDAFLNVRYEDLYQYETAILRKCLRFAGVDDSDESIRLCNEAGKFERVSGGRKRGQTDPNSFYRKGVIGDWTNHLSLDLAERCCAPVADLMEEFGYSLHQTSRLAKAA